MRNEPQDFILWLDKPVYLSGCSYIRKYIFRSAVHDGGSKHTRQRGESIAILNHNKPTAYLTPATTYQQILDRLEDYELGLIVKEREHEKKQAIEINFNEL